MLFLGQASYLLSLVSGLVCTATQWWERSPWASDTTNFCNVNTNGNANANNASNSRGVSFGFGAEYKSIKVTYGRNSYFR